MEFLDSIKNSELVVSFIKNDDNSLVIAMRGKISSSVTGSLLDSGKDIYKNHVFDSTKSWQRVIIDVRGLNYVNSIGAAMMINLHRQLAALKLKVIMLLNKNSEVTFTLKSIGFFTVENPKVVWENYDLALRS